MGFKDFRIGLVLRIVFLNLTIIPAIYCYFLKYYSYSLLLGMAAIGISIYLYRYVVQTNYKLIKFFEALRYSDFSITFTKDNKLGKSFRELNKCFNEIIEAVKKARSENEENLHYLNTIVQHISIGLFSFDNLGNIEIFNNAACRMLNVPRIKRLSELALNYPELVESIQNLRPGKNLLFRKDINQEFVVFASEIRMREKVFKIVSMQNIHNQLQEKELEAWQNLSKVLRHEIMNSITPIASLASTLKEIVEHDLPSEDGSTEAIADIKTGLRTIENRSQGLIKFVNAYKSFTNIPQPKIKKVRIKEFLENIINLLLPDLKNNNILISLNIMPEDIEINLDPDLIENVIINLMKNAKEALSSQQNGKIEINCYINDTYQTIIEVNDNGPGIVQEALERIFVPFYSTKKEGSGIGLSLSRQIMQLHNGTLTVSSRPNERTSFVLSF